MPPLTNKDRVRVRGERTMIAFDAGSWRFQYRVGALVIREGHVLLMKMGGDAWFVPGGRIEAGESAKPALEREIREELGVAGRVGRLLWIGENFFRINERRYHEVGLYFEVTLPGDALTDLSARILGSEGDGAPFECAWHSLESLNQIRVVPSFLSSGLTRLPNAPQHVVEVEPAVAPYVA